MRFTSLTPMLQTQDLPGTRVWYESVLGFAAAGASTDEWLSLSRDGVEIMFMVNAHLGTPAATATQYFQVDDVLDLWETVKDRVTAEWEPAEMPYGMLEFAVKDNNGYLLSFGQPV